MCIYLLDIYYPKIHLSYILLFIQNKTLVQTSYFKLGSIFFNNSPISSNLFKFHPNNLEFPKRDIGTHKNLRCFFFSFISCCAGACKSAAALSGSWKSRDFFIGSFSHSAQLATRLQTYTKAASSSSDLYRTACETTATPTATPATHYLQTGK